MRIKALLTIFILATAPIFLRLIEDIPTAYSQEESLPEGAVIGPLPSPLQPAATLNAEELKNLEDGVSGIQIDAEDSALGRTISLKYMLLGWQILGVKIIPLFAALTAMLLLSAVLTGFRETFFVRESLAVEDGEQEVTPREEKPRRKSSSAKDKSSAEATSGGRGRSSRKKQPSKRKRGRPPKKRPRGRPRKSTT